MFDFVFATLSLGLCVGGYFLLINLFSLYHLPDVRDQCILWGNSGIGMVQLLPLNLDHSMNLESLIFDLGSISKYLLFALDILS